MYLSGRIINGNNTSFSSPLSFLHTTTTTTTTLHPRKSPSSLTFTFIPPSINDFVASSGIKTENRISRHCKCFSSTRIIGSKNSSLAIQIGALLSTVAEPAVAITGVNNEEDFTWVLIQLGISAFFYFIVSPPIIMNWLRIRWYRRKLLEMYLQFMFVFMFFPGLLLWAPFLNFRKFPRDPSMKYPWSKPENPSEIKGGFLKWPYATPEDYDQ